MAGARRHVLDQARSMAEIQKKPELEALLKRWDENLKLIQTSIESKWARGRALKIERYMLISFYLVFQGAVRNTLASKANASQCGFALFPALLSFMATVGVLVSVHDKFHDCHKINEKRQTEESESERLQFSINTLLRTGGSLEPEAWNDEYEGTPTKPAWLLDSQPGVERWFLKERSYLDVMGSLITVKVDAKFFSCGATATSATLIVDRLCDHAGHNLTTQNPTQELDAGSRIIFTLFPTNKPLPPEYRLVTLREVHDHREALRRAMPGWEIANLADGSVDEMNHGGCTRLDRRDDVG